MGRIPSTGTTNSLDESHFPSRVTCSYFLHLDTKWEACTLNRPHFMPEGNMCGHSCTARGIRASGTLTP